jgi:hypothetical protein
MSPSLTGILQGFITMGRDRAAAFDVTYTQGGEKRWKLVYACDEHAAGLVVIKSTWAPVVILEAKAVVSKPRSKRGEVFA